MAEKISIEDLSRQPLVRGTSCFTDPAGNVGYKNEDLQVSALVRIAAALEQQTELMKEPNPLSLFEYGELHGLVNTTRNFQPWILKAYGKAEAAKLLRFCDLVEKLLSGMEGGPSNG